MRPLTELLSYQEIQWLHVLFDPNGFSFSCRADIRLLQFSFEDGTILGQFMPHLTMGRIHLLEWFRCQPNTLEIVSNDTGILVLIDTLTHSWAKHVAAGLTNCAAEVEKFDLTSYSAPLLEFQENLKLILP